MALGATIHHVELSLSDVDRGVYEELDLRLAQHPSETMRFLVTRLLAYALSYEEGIAFSRGGLSSTDEPPIAVRDPTGVLLLWVDVGAPSAERLHKASKAARRVAVFTTDLAHLRREASQRAIHKADAIDVFRLDPAFVDALASKMDRSSALELTRNDGQLYAALGHTTLETPIARVALSEVT